MDIKRFAKSFGRAAVLTIGASGGLFWAVQKAFAGDVDLLFCVAHCANGMDIYLGVCDGSTTVSCCAWVDCTTGEHSELRCCTLLLNYCHIDPVNERAWCDFIPPPCQTPDCLGTQ